MRLFQSRFPDRNQIPAPPHPARIRSVLFAPQNPDRRLQFLFPVPCRFRLLQVQALLVPDQNFPGLFSFLLQSQGSGPNQDPGHQDPDLFPLLPGLSFPLHPNPGQYQILHQQKLQGWALFPRLWLAFPYQPVQAAYPAFLVLQVPDPKGSVALARIQIRIQDRRGRSLRRPRLQDRKS